MKFLKILLFAILLFNFINLYAEAYKYKVELSKKEAMVGESLDITIKALDKNKNIIHNYDGLVMWYSDTDKNLKIENELVNNKGYQFKKSDKGIKKIKNAVTFTKEGEHEIIVYEDGASLANGTTNIIIKKGESKNKNNIKVDKYKVELSKKEAILGQSIDIIIKALDENGNIINDYDGLVMWYSDTDKNLKIENELVNNKGYQFKKSDKGIKKFKNAVTFTKEGEHEIIVYEDGASLANGIVNIIIKKCHILCYFDKKSGKKQYIFNKKVRTKIKNIKNKIIKMPFLNINMIYIIPGYRKKFLNSIFFK